MVVLTGVLMVSTLRYRHFAQRMWPVLPRSVKLIVCILLLIFVDVALAHKLYTQFFSLLCFAMALTYGVYGLDPDTYLPGRRRGAASAPPAEPE